MKRPDQKRPDLDWPQPGPQQPEAPLLLTVFATFAVGGPQVRFAALANRLGPARRHAIVAMDGNLACRERLDAGLDVIFPAVGARGGDWLGNLRRFRRLLRQLRPDVLLTHNWGSIEWALANAPPGGRRLARHVHVEDGFGPEECSRQIGRRVWLRRLTLRRVSVAMPSRTLLRIAERVWRLAPARLHYVPNGIDVARFAPFPSRSGNVSVSAESLVIGTVAALRPEKNLARLLRAVALVPGARLLVVGDGPDRAGLQVLAVSLGLAGRVNFAGHLADPAAAYREMDVFALSSDTEQMPLSVLEAMAAGLPIAATDVGDVADMVAAENAPFVVACDDKALASALARLAADPVLRRHVGAANRAKAARDYDQKNMLAAWGGLLGIGQESVCQSAAA